MNTQNFFNEISEDDWLYQSNHFFIVPDKHLVNSGHLLIISKEIRLDYFELTRTERIDLSDMIVKAKTLIEENYTPDGYNIGINCGSAAGQTVFHFHCHVIPRYEGDMKDPRGGVRHCVEGKGYY